MRSILHKIIFVCLLLCSLSLSRMLCATALAVEEPAPVYTFGVVPQFEQRKLYAIWQPIIAELTRRTGFKFKLVTTLSIESFEKEFMSGGFDFVYMNPYHILKAPRYLPLVADTVPLRGILVVRRDSPLRSLKELEGKEVAFPSPNALGASLLMRADLARVQRIKVKPLYVKTHSSVYLHVVQGLTAAGGGVEKSLSEQAPAIRNALRVIYTTREMTPHPVAANRRIRPADREKLRQALLAMDATPEGRALLANIPTKGLMPVSRADYERMRAWGLDAYWVDLWKSGANR